MQMMSMTAEQVHASRAEQRRLRLLEAEREQAEEDAQALLITEEQREMLLRPFREVKAEFQDLDGFRWTEAQLAAHMSAMRPFPQTPAPRLMEGEDETIRIRSRTAEDAPPETPVPARRHRDGSKARSPVKGLFPPSSSDGPPAPPRPPGLASALPPYSPDATISRSAGKKRAHESGASLTPDLSPRPSLLSTSPFTSTNPTARHASASEHPAHVQSARARLAALLESPHAPPTHAPHPSLGHPLTRHPSHSAHPRTARSFLPSSSPLVPVDHPALPSTSQTPPPHPSVSGLREGRLKGWRGDAVSDNQGEEGWCIGCDDENCEDCAEWEYCDEDCEDDCEDDCDDDEDCEDDDDEPLYDDYEDALPHSQGDARANQRSRSKPPALPFLSPSTVLRPPSHEHTSAHTYEPEDGEVTPRIEDAPGW